MKSPKKTDEISRNCSAILGLVKMCTVGLIGTNKVNDLEDLLGTSGLD